MPVLPPLATIRVFEAAARHENYSRAAEELALTQAGVSYQIKLLEERLGARLFVRQGRGVALTALGRRIAPQISDAFAGLRNAFASVQAENDNLLSISCGHSVAFSWLAPRLGTFNLARPALAVRLDANAAMVDLVAGEMDVAIRAVREPGPGLVGHFLMHRMVTPMASPDFLARHPISKPADLLKVQRLSPDDEWWGLWFDSLGGMANSGASDPGLRFDSQTMDSNAAIAGHGVAILSPPLFTGALRSGQLVAPFDHFAVDPRPLWLVYSEHKRRLAKIRAFRDWLLEAVKQCAGDGPAGMLTPPPGY